MFHHHLGACFLFWIGKEWVIGGVIGFEPDPSLLGISLKIDPGKGYSSLNTIIFRGELLVLGSVDLAI